MGRRVRCRSLGLLSAASLLLALASALLWARSWWRADQLEWVRYTEGPVWYGPDDEFGYYPEHAVRVRSASGWVACWSVRVTAPPSQAWQRPDWWYAHAAELRRLDVRPAGFRWHRRGPREWVRDPPPAPPRGGGFALWNGTRPGGASRPIESYAGISVPLWLPALAFAVLPALDFARARRTRRRRRQNLCVSCGYDLRASPERCPECGEAVRSGKALVR